MLPVTPRCRPHVTSQKTEPPRDVARIACERTPKTKKAFRGIAPEGLELE